jgi:predicted membrane metal-binding protein
VLCASSVALVLGLLLLQIPVIRKPWILLTLGVALLALSIWLPEAAIMFSQAAVLGLVLLLFGAFLQRLVARRRTKTGFVHPATESSILDRSNSPTRVRSMSLAGASTTTGPGEIQLPPTQSQDG